MKVKNFVINVRTQKEYDKLMELLGDNDYYWVVPGESPIRSNDYDNFYLEEKEKTCIQLSFYKIINYSDINYFLSENYAIISFDYFMENTDLKYKPKEMTVEEIEEELGYRIKVIGEE